MRRTPKIKLEDSCVHAIISTILESVFQTDPIWSYQWANGYLNESTKKNRQRRKERSYINAQDEVEIATNNMVSKEAKRLGQMAEDERDSDLPNSQESDQVQYKRRELFVNSKQQTTTHCVPLIMTS